MPDTATTNGAAGSDAGGRRRRVLVADDTEDMRVILEFRLTRAGCDVVLVTDGQAAWDALSADAYDVVVLDQRMPGLTGLEVCERIMDLEARPRVVLFSAQLDNDIARRAIDIGVDAVLHKAEMNTIGRHPVLQFDD